MMAALGLAVGLVGFLIAVCCNGIVVFEGIGAMVAIVSIIIAAIGIWKEE